MSGCKSVIKITSLSQAVLDGLTRHRTSKRYGLFALIFGTVLSFFVVLGILFFVLYKPQLQTEFHITQAASDTTFQNSIWQSDDGYGKRIALRVKGELDNTAEVCIRDPDYPNKFFVTELPKGTFDITRREEYYKEKADIVFLHKRAKKGSIKIIFSYIIYNENSRR